MLTFILVPGHQTSKFPDRVSKSKWEQTLTREFPDASVKVYLSVYDMFDHGQVSLAVEGLMKMIAETEGDIVILAHSFGGFISQLALQKMGDRHTIRALITMGTPFQVPNKRQETFLQRFYFSNTVSVPFLGFGGYLDPYAFPFFILPKGNSVTVKNFWCTHNDFFFSEKTRSKVARQVRGFLLAQGIGFV